MPLLWEPSGIYSVDLRAVWRHHMSMLYKYRRDISPLDAFIVPVFRSNVDTAAE